LTTKLDDRFVILGRLDARFNFADHGIMFCHGFLAPLFELAFCHGARRKLRLDDRG